MHTPPDAQRHPPRPDPPQSLVPSADIGHSVDTAVSENTAPLSEVARSQERSQGFSVSLVQYHGADGTSGSSLAG